MRILLSLILMSFWGCRSNPVQKSPIMSCASFDIRQCQTDKFAKTVLESGTQMERASQMKDWLISMNVNAIEVKLDLNFYESVCEACDMCPTPDRYLIQVEGPFQNIDALKLLNFKILDC